MGRKKPFKSGITRLALSCKALHPQKQVSFSRTQSLFSPFPTTKSRDWQGFVRSNFTWP